MSDSVKFVKEKSIDILTYLSEHHHEVCLAYKNRIENISLWGESRVSIDCRIRGWRKNYVVAVSKYYDWKIKYYRAKKIESIKSKIK